MGSFYVNYTVRSADDAVREVGELLSIRLKTQVLADLNHDDDMLWYGLFESGRLTDEYNSAPAYFDGGTHPPSGGDARKLCAAFGRSGSEKALDAVLRKTDYAVAMERHADLVKALALPDFAVGCGFNYLEEGELPEGLAADQLMRVK